MNSMHPLKLAIHIFCLIGLNLILNVSYSWNELGHRIVAQIAFDNLSPQAKKASFACNRVLNKIYKTRSFVNAASWLDTLHKPEELWLKPLHYIDIPISFDGTQTSMPNKDNAVSAIQNAIKILENPHVGSFDKALNWRILLHVVGDIHQPMHAINQFSAKFPHGDKGGNLVHLSANPVAKNLHAYWDKGGGLLLADKKHSKKYLKKITKIIENDMPCSTSKSLILNPQIWADESYQLGIKAYKFDNRYKLSGSYQKLVKKITKERLALAGCRLALILNKQAGNMRCINAG